MAALIASNALAQQLSEAGAQQAASQMSQAFASAYNAGKPADVVALFTKRGTYLTPGGTMLTDHEEMKFELAGRQKVGWTDETINVIEAHPEGNDVLALVQYSIRGSGANSGKQIGGYAAQLITREGTNWRIKLLAANLKLAHDITGMAGAEAGPD
jgi:hypothetical protein